MNANASSNTIASIFNGSQIAQIFNSAVANASYQVPSLTSAVAPESVPTTPRTADEDFEFARRTIIGAIGDGQSALSELMSIASQSQHPRAFEVLKDMLNTIVTSSRELLELQKKSIEIEETKSGGKRAEKIQNQLFVGSTTELSKALKVMRGEEEEDGGS